MLASLISSSSLTSGTLSMTMVPGIPEGASVAAATLILLLLLRDFLPVSKSWNNTVKDSLNMGIIPLLFSFGAAIIFKFILLFYQRFTFSYIFLFFHSSLLG